MNPKALKAFCLIVTRGSLAAAADEMRLSQPAVSRLITNLEYDLKLKLFSRDKRTLVPSPEGRNFYREASRVLAAFDHLPHMAAEIGAGRTGRLRVVVMPRIASAVVAPAIAAFSKQQPNVWLSVEVHARRDLERWLASHQFDMAFGPLPVAHAGIVGERLFSSPMFAAVHVDSPLAQRPFLEATDLAVEPLIAIASGTLTRQQADAVFLRARETSNILMEVSSSPLALQIVASGVGYALCDMFVAAGIAGQRLVLVPVAPKVDMEFAVLWPENMQPTPAMRAFSELVRRSGEALLRQSTAAKSLEKRKRR
jgi:DNA-binding transcriptional LysR family regulator